MMVVIRKVVVVTWWLSARNFGEWSRACHGGLAVKNSWAGSVVAQSDHGVDAGGPAGWDVAGEESDCADD